MKVTDVEARKIYREGGARVDDSEEMVYLDPEMVEEVIKTVPPEFSMHARNPEKSVTLGGNHITFSGLLNALDGVYAQEGNLIFMTTNHKENLDPALIRPGRIDRQLEFKHTTRDQLQGMFEHFYL